MLPYSTQLIEQDDIDAINEALRGSLLTQGHTVEKFEEYLCRFCDAKYALAFNSATSALYAAYNICDLKDSEVITTPISFVATSNMILQNNATPVFCDIKNDGNIDEKKINSLITPKTKAIASIDYGGKSVEALQIKELAKKNDLIFISDSSHSLGSRFKNQKVGSIADISIFSFHPLKPITTLEGGALLTNSQDFYEKAKLIRSHGVIKQKLWHYDVLSNGFNFRMNEIQATLGITQLQKLERFIQIREEIASFYDDFFKDNPYFDTTHQNNLYTSSNHLYPILLKKELWEKKEKIFHQLLENQIGVQVHYKPIYHFSFYQDKFSNLFLPQAEDFYNAEISIPCHQKMDLTLAKKVAQKILSILEKF
ncbi:MULTISPECIES: UDP-4-amino-4,6-dideoxy-N-acetyl-beta-L-altrosamine transaminase [unclassified Helicobacter]|uniref:UDP-4-amino-4, 6-dideoxy-N-acetyl-beta-L-altrosamine transaminase n=1 Tax=unclassified Helicobacter TaxID=2593540 RepID=UPI000CF08306|nr:MULTISPECIES: UDP-4-amino-4,6-dideoxy-N-acetyl-beta-L-altrosamine transaminase [unclassified Helicobacter]